MINSARVTQTMINSAGNPGERADAEELIIGGMQGSDVVSAEVPTENLIIGNGRPASTPDAADDQPNARWNPGPTAEPPGQSSPSGRRSP